MRITMVVVLILSCVTSLRSQESSLPPGSPAYTTAPVGVRVQPRPTARLVARLEPGTALQVATCSKGWCSVKAGAISGHILSEYIGLEPPTRPHELEDTTILVAVLAFLLFALVFVFIRYRRIGAQLRDIRDRFRGVIDVEAERQRALGELTTAQAALQTANGEAQKLSSQIDDLRAEFQALDEEANLRSFGFYKPHYDFADSERYQKELDRIRELQETMLKAKTAALCSAEWRVNGSLTEGRKQTNRTLKLILRAFNGESDAAVAKVKYNNVQVMEARIRKAWEALNKLVEIQQCRIAEGYLDLKLQELALAHEYQEKLQKEREEQRIIREKMRDEEIARREIEKARQEAERDETHYQEALVQAREEAERAVGEKHEKLVAKVEELQRRLAEAQTNKERALARAQLTRSGHVYVISNVGSFGEQVYKIGMTRRLDPLERIHELGDASVPFAFDVHAVIYSEDAPALEATLHHEFDQRRVNLVNERKEFFGVSIDDIAGAVKKCHGEIELTLAAEAKEYRETLALLAQRNRIPTTHNADGRP